MTDNFDIVQFINNYIKNIRAMQQLTDDQIRDVMLLKIEKNPEYFEIIADVSKKVDNNKLIRQVMVDTHIPQTTKQDKFTGRQIA